MFVASVVVFTVEFTEWNVSNSKALQKKQQAGLKTCPQHNDQSMSAFSSVSE